jgi:hypothetical protein
LKFKVLFMEQDQQGLKALTDIRNMMERSSRFISLSGWSGIAAGVWALAGAVAGHLRIRTYYRDEYGQGGEPQGLLRSLVLIAAVVLVAALISAVLFTLRRSRKQGVPVWGVASRRLIWNTALPLGVGGLFVIRMMQLGEYELVAPGCLIFYGLALVNGSKYTLGEIRYLGYTMLALGIINLWSPGDGLYFWAAGFGVCHIIYGLAMWMKYERNEEAGQQ